MKFKNFKASLNIIIGMLRRLMEPLVIKGDKFLKMLLVYLQTSETIFLLLFAGIIGVGTGFAAILFRWMIGFFQNLFFNQGQHLLSFIGSYYVTLVPAAGGIVAFTGWGFIRLLYKCEDLFDALKTPSFIKPAIGGLIIGLIGSYFPKIFGVGHSAIQQTLNGQVGPILAFGLIGIKILATSVTQKRASWMHLRSWERGTSGVFRFSCTGIMSILLV